MYVYVCVMAVSVHCVSVHVCVCVSMSMYACVYMYICLCVYMYVCMCALGYPQGLSGASPTSLRPIQRLFWFNAIPKPAHVGAMHTCKESFGSIYINIHMFPNAPLGGPKWSRVCPSDLVEKKLSLQ